MINRYYDQMERELNGYPATNPLSKHWQHGQSGHRILIRGMGSREIRTGIAIRSLTDIHQQVIFACYGLSRDHRGKPITNEQRAQWLGIPVRTFDSRLQSARKSLTAKLKRNSAADA